MRYLSLMAISIVVLLCGCANPYKQFYSEDQNYQRVFTKQSDKCVEPSIYTAEHDKTLFVRMYKDGYVPVGMSSFNSSGASKSDLEKFAKELGACMVLVKSQFTHTEQGSYYIPQYNQGQNFTVNTTGDITRNGRLLGTYQSTSTAQSPGYWTSQAVPYTVHRSDYIASYWVKLKSPAPLGILPTDIPTEMKKKYDIAQGVFILAVRRGTPAEAAGLFDEDIIVSIDGRKATPDNGKEVMEPVYGRDVDFEIVRDGKTLIKRVKVGEKTY